MILNMDFSIVADYYQRGNKLLYQFLNVVDDCAVDEIRLMQLDRSTFLLEVGISFI